MGAATGIELLGRRLSLLASAGQAMVLLTNSLMLLALYAISTGGPRPAEFFVAYNAFPLLAGITVAASQFWALQRLHRVGQALRDHPPISMRLAHCFKRLGLAILVCGIATSLLGGWFNGIDAGLPRIFYEADLASLYIALVGSLTAYSVAWILVDGVRIRQELEDFV